MPKHGLPGPGIESQPPEQQRFQAVGISWCMLLSVIVHWASMPHPASPMGHADPGRLEAVLSPFLVRSALLVFAIPFLATWGRGPLQRLQRLSRSGRTKTPVHHGRAWADHLHAVRWLGLLSVCHPVHPWRCSFKIRGWKLWSVGGSACRLRATAGLNALLGFRHPSFWTLWLAGDRFRAGLAGHGPVWAVQLIAGLSVCFSAAFTAQVTGVLKTGEYWSSACLRELRNQPARFWSDADPCTCARGRGEPSLASWDWPRPLAGHAKLLGACLLDLGRSLIRPGPSALALGAQP